MDATSMRSPSAQPQAPDGRPASIAVWLLCFGLVAYLGLDGGGYDPLVQNQVGILIWWIVLAGVAVGALPRRRLPATAWAALGLLAAFVCWTALSLAWTESTFRTAADVARVCGYLAIFALALLARARGELSRMIGAVGAGIACVAVVALLSRLHPAWFPDAGQTAIFIDDSRERLSYPLNYWNGLAALIAIGVPLLLQGAAEAKSALLRGLAAAALPAMALTAFLTLSRGGIGASLIAIVVYLAFARDRLPKLPTLSIAAAGSAILVLAASARDALQEGLGGEVARRQGDELLWICLVVCAAVGMAQVALSYFLLRWERPRWARVPRRQAAVGTAAAALVLLVAAVAFDAPGRAADSWDEFRDGGGPGAGTSRLSSVAGQSRYQLWEAAVEQNATRPVAGTGSATFELWWAEHGRTGESVRDTHSLYLQTLGELGIVGFLLIVAFLLLVIFVGAWATLADGSSRRSWLAAALAGCIAFCLTAAVDWMWQIPVLAVTMLLLGAVLVAERRGANGARLPTPLRIGLVGAALLAIAAIAVPLATAALLRDSEANARAGDLDAALVAARTAQNIQPGAAAPRLQEALVLEARGSLGIAAEAADAAIAREEVNWRNWLVLSRIEAQRGNAAASVRAFRRARSLNPLSPVFDR